MSAVRSWYVRRERGDRIGYVGSLRPQSRAEREAEAWRSCGWTADVLPNTLEARREVRAWSQSVAERRIREGQQ